MSRWNKPSIKRKYDHLIKEIDDRMRNGERISNLAKDFNIPIGTLYRKLEEYRAN